MQLLITTGVAPVQESPPPSPDNAPNHQPQTSTKPSFDGFRNTAHVSKWDRLISHWLPTFDPTALLIRKINSQAPVGQARGLWAECARAATNLLSQFEEITDEGDYIPSVQFDQMYMLIRCLPALLLQVDPRDSFHARQQKVTKRCGKFLRGEWPNLVSSTVQMMKGRNQYAREQLKQNPNQRPDSDDKRHERALELARSLNYSKAMHTLRSAGTSKDDMADIRQALHALHPSERETSDGRQHPGTVPIQRASLDFINGAWVRAQLRKSKKGTAVDQWGWDMREMWEDFSKDDQLLEDIAQHWLRPVAAGYLPEKYRAHLAGGRLVALSKAPKPGIRPICISDAWRRLTAKGLGKECYNHVQEFFQHSHPRALQFGGNNKNGATNMFHLLATIVAEAPVQPQQDTAEPDPIVLISLDLKNAFNALSRESLLDLLGYGCESFVTLKQRTAHATPLPVGWDLLWRHIIGHYGAHGALKHYHSGSVELVSSESGVQQGDPLGSTLFAMAIHPTLIDIADKHPEVLLTAYADNVVISGPLTQCLKAVDSYRLSMAAKGLQLNPTESEVHVPAWTTIDAASIRHSRLQKGPDAHLFCTDNGIALPWSQSGIKVLGCPLGSSKFCSQLMNKLATKIEGDISALLLFPHIHQRLKLATYCANTRAAYFLRAASLDASRPAMKGLDSSFESFWATTLNFEAGYQHSAHQHEYANALTQIRLGIKQGGCGFTSNDILAPAALFAGICGFIRWSHSHQDTFSCKWLGSTAPTPFTAGPNGHVVRNLEAAIRDLAEWDILAADEADLTDDMTATASSSDLDEPADTEVISSDHRVDRRVQHAGVPPQSQLAGTGPDLFIPSVLGLQDVTAWPFIARPSQQTISKAIKKSFLSKFLLRLPEHGKIRIRSLSRHTVPAQHALSDIAPAISGQANKDTLSQGSMNLFALTCPFELSNEAAVTSTSILLEIPIPHVRFLKSRLACHHHLDLWGDTALNDPVHAANTRKSSHDKIAQELAAIATAAGVLCTARERDIPFTEQDDPNQPGRSLNRRGDIVTKCGGLVPTNQRAGFTRWTRLVLDVKLGHTFASQHHHFKPNTIAAMESLKRSKYQTAYRTKGIAFAPAVCNSWGELGADLLRFLWAVASHAASQHDSAAPLGLGPAPLPGRPGASERQDEAFKRLRGRLYHEYRTRILCSVFEGVTERVFGRTFALIGDPRYLQWLEVAKPLWQPVFLPPLVVTAAAAASAASAVMPSPSPPPPPTAAAAAAASVVVAAAAAPLAAVVGAAAAAAPVLAAPAAVVAAPAPARARVSAPAPASPPLPAVPSPAPPPLPPPPPSLFPFPPSPPPFVFVLTRV